MERTGSESILKEKGDGRAISSQYRGGVMTVVRRIECEERRNQKQTNEKILCSTFGAQSRMQATAKRAALTAR